jgi:hypothetical protein
LSALAGSLGSEQAEAVARVLAGCVAADGVPYQLSSNRELTRGLGVCVGRTGPGRAEAIARTLASRMAAQTDPESLLMLAEGLAAVAPALSDARLLDVFKSYAVFPVVRDAALSEFARRDARTRSGARAALAGWAPVAALKPSFADTWAFVEWAERNHPEWDLKNQPPNAWGVE